MPKVNTARVWRSRTSGTELYFHLVGLTAQPQGFSPSPVSGLSYGLQHASVQGGGGTGPWRQASFAPTPCSLEERHVQPPEPGRAWRIHLSMATELSSGSEGV